MKILYPHGEATKEEIEEILRFAIEGRKRVKDQILRIDSTYPTVRFIYLTADGQERSVRTLEEEEYQSSYHRRVAIDNTSDDLVTQASEAPSTPVSVAVASPSVATAASRPVRLVELKEKHRVFQENQRGASFDTVFGPYLAGAAPNHDH